jgi:hypothetical protein
MPAPLQKLQVDDRQTAILVERLIAEVACIELLLVTYGG